MGAAGELRARKGARHPSSYPEACRWRKNKGESETSRDQGQVGWAPYGEEDDKARAGVSRRGHVGDRAPPPTGLRVKAGGSCPLGVPSSWQSLRPVQSLPCLGSWEPQRCDSVPHRRAPAPTSDFLWAAHQRAEGSRPGTGLLEREGADRECRLPCRDGTLLRCHPHGCSKGPWSHELQLPPQRPPHRSPSPGFPPFLPFLPNSPRPPNALPAPDSLSPGPLLSDWT